jgi:hypothetical protein
MRGAVLYRPPATVWVSLALVTPLEYWAIVRYHLHPSALPSPSRRLVGLASSLPSPGPLPPLLFSVFS